MLHEIVVISPIKVTFLLQSLQCCDSPHSQLDILNLFNTYEKIKYKYFLNQSWK